MHKLILTLILTFTVCVMSAQDFLKLEEVVTLEAKSDAPQLVAEMTNLLESQGYTVFAVIDHQENAGAAGTELNSSTLIIFGNPEMGSQVLSEFPLMGLDLPMKFLIWTSSRGISYISYTKPSYLFQKNTGNDVREYSAKMDEMLYGLAKEMAN